MATNYTPPDIHIIRLDSEGDALDRLSLKTVPEELMVEPVANWAVIPSVGRNNPFYHYTGGEDVLNFTIDWYCQEESREDVIKACKWLAALSKNDGYINEPPRVLLVWGRLFRGITWIVEKAPYRLSLFSRQYSMLPMQAYQDVTLRRVTEENTTLEQNQSLYGT